MDDVKNKMYNYETTPPSGVWESIASQLDVKEAKVIAINNNRSKQFYFMAAASVAIIIFCVIFFTSRSPKAVKEEPVYSTSTSEQIGNDQKNEAETSQDENVRITVPVEEKKDETNKDNDELLAKNNTVKGGGNEKIKKEDFKKSDSTNTKLIASNIDPRYITIEGLQGQPVKVSSKMATLIDSSDESVPPKPIWNKKINEWREIMKGNTLAPTPGNFLDIIELTRTLREPK
jgi:hypothetical protein